MKTKLILLLLGLLSISNLKGQFATHDAGANVSLSRLNLKVLNLNRKVSKSNSKLEETNKRLEEANEYLKQLAALKEEEINSYKNAPDNRLINYQRNSLFEEKKKMVVQVKNLIKKVDDLKFIKENEKDKIKKRLGTMITQIMSIWLQTTQLLTVNDKIIPANERQKLLENTLQIFEKYISKIVHENAYLEMVNNSRKSRVELIGF